MATMLVTTNLGQMAIGPSSMLVSTHFAWLS